MKRIISCLVILALCALMLVACGVSKELTAAKDYVYAMYKDAAATTPLDYQLIGVVNNNGVKYGVDWKVDVKSGDKEGVKVVVGEDGTVTVDVDEKAAAEIAYTLTATVKDAKGKALEVTFERKVPMFKELTWAEYVAAKDDDTVVVKGVVTGIMAKSKGNTYNCLYMQDNDGGYYVYSMATDPVTDDGVEVGMTVRVTGKRATYSGTIEIASATVEILDKNKTEVTAADFTEKFAAATSLKDTALVAQQGMLVTVKGVEVTGEDVASGYFKFKLGSLETYVRISSSVCPIGKDDQTAFKAAHASHLGWTADVTGVICVYDGAFYLTPITVDSFTYVSLPKKDDAGMVAFEKDQLTFVSAISESKEITLDLAGKSYTDVKIAWTSDNAAAVVSDDGAKLTVTLPDADATVKLTATLTCGTATDTVVFEVKLVAGELSYEEIVDAAYALEEGAALEGKYRLFGVISEIGTAYSEAYKNITVTIVVGGLTDKAIVCFRLKGEGAEALAVGDAITVEGVIKNYKGTVEFDSGCVLVGKGEIIDQSKTVKAAYALGEGEAMSSPVALKGVISEIGTAYSEQYKNITVTIVVDGLTDSPIVCFRLKGEGVEALAVGDEIAVLGLIKNYKGTVEFDSGCVLVPVADLGQVKTVLAAHALAEGAAMKTNKTLTGVISEIGTAYSEQYKNITVTIVVDGMTDKAIVCFRLKGEGAETLAVGDTITVTGLIKNYKGTVEFDSGCTFVK